MFGSKKDNRGQPDSNPGPGKGTPEGQPDYLSIDDAAPLPDDPAAGAAAQLQQLRIELDEADGRWKRTLADYQNFQRRALQNELEARRQGVVAVIHSVLPVLDHFDLALCQPCAEPAAAGIIEGVKVIRGELIKALEAHGVRIINPQPNTEFDPNRHAAISQMPADGVHPGHISQVFQIGYELDERVIRSAKVAVAPSAD